MMENIHCLHIHSCKVYQSRTTQLLVSVSLSIYIYTYIDIIFTLSRNKKVQLGKFSTITKRYNQGNSQQEQKGTTRETLNKNKKVQLGKLLTRTKRYNQGNPQQEQKGTTRETLNNNKKVQLGKLTTKRYNQGN